MADTISLLPSRYSFPRGPYTPSSATTSAAANMLRRPARGPVRPIFFMTALVLLMAKPRYASHSFSMAIGSRLFIRLYAGTTTTPPKPKSRGSRRNTVAIVERKSSSSDLPVFPVRAFFFSRFALANNSRALHTKSSMTLAAFFLSGSLVITSPTEVGNTNCHWRATAAL